MRLKNQQLFSVVNRIIFPWLYLGQGRRGRALVRADRRTRFEVRVNTSDRLVIWEIWRLGAYDDRRFPIRATDVVVDVGAHIGAFAVRAAQQAARGRVVACEAASENYRLLRVNARLNRLGNLRAERVAVWKEPGTLDLYAPSKNGALNSALQDDGGAHETAPAATLAEVMDRHALTHVDHLKLDTEGAEYPILFSCSPDTLHRISYMVLEYHQFAGLAWGPRDLERFLTSHGFHVEYSGGVFPQKLLFGTACMKAWR